MMYEEMLKLANEFDIKSEVTGQYAKVTNDGDEYDIWRKSLDGKVWIANDSTKDKVVAFAKFVLRNEETKPDNEWTKNFLEEIDREHLESCDTMPA